MGFITLEDLKSPKKLGILICIIGGIQFIVVTLIAMFFYPGGYNFFFNYFSTLGVTVTSPTHTLPNVPNVISFIMFFMAIIIAGIVIIPFFIIIRTLFKDEKKMNIIAWIGSIVGIISAPFLMGVAIFPGNLFPGPTGLHSISAKSFFIIFALAIIIYSVAILLNKNYPNGYAIFSMIIAVVAIAYAIIPMGILDAFMQKMVVYSFIFWTLIQSLKVLKIVET
ncbi:MAG: hypothetical protein EAX96_15475 [Candidatus Lokiarchaeota archaeon]|nr:hypothetical protein [Candidatus Lokiarchaeota archaeon]